jgi:hypothetical protein
MSHDAKLAALMFRVMALVLGGYNGMVFLVRGPFAIAAGSPFLSMPGVLLFGAAVLLFLAAPLLGRLAAAWLPATAASPGER